MASPGLLSHKEDSKEKEMLKTKTFNNLFFMKEVKRKLTIKEREKYKIQKKIIKI